MSDYQDEEMRPAVSAADHARWLKAAIAARAKERFSKLIALFATTSDEPTIDAPPPSIEPMCTWCGMALDAHTKHCPSGD